MVKRIELVLPTEYENDWENLKNIFGLEDSELLMRLIEMELRTIKSKEHMEAYEKVEKAMHEIEELAGMEGMKELVNKLELIVAKVKEAIE